jgi:hypothetical protein
MENAALDRHTRAIYGSSLSRDLASTTAIGVISNLVTLYLISTTGAPQLAISVVIISTFLFTFLSGMNTMDQFKAWIADADEQEANSHSGKLGKQAPFTMWKIIYSLTFLAMAVTQLVEVWT